MVDLVTGVVDTRDGWKLGEEEAVVGKIDFLVVHLQVEVDAQEECLDCTAV